MKCTATKCTPCNAKPKTATKTVKAMPKAMNRGMKSMGKSSKK